MTIERERARLEPLSMESSEETTSENESISKKLMEALIHISSEQTIIRKEVEQAMSQLPSLAEAANKAEKERLNLVQSVKKLLEEVRADLNETKQQRELRGEEYMQANRDTAAWLVEIIQKLEYVKKPIEKPPLKEVLTKTGVIAMSSILGGIIMFLVFLLLQA